MSHFMLCNTKLECIQHCHHQSAIWPTSMDIVNSGLPISINHDPDDDRIKNECFIIP